MTEQTEPKFIFTTLPSLYLQYLSVFEVHCCISTPAKALIDNKSIRTVTVALLFLLIIRTPLVFSLITVKYEYSIKVSIYHIGNYIIIIGQAKPMFIETRIHDDSLKIVDRAIIITIDGF